MKPLPPKHELDIFWTVATSTSIETGTRPYYGFAYLLYDYLTDNLKNKYGVELRYEPQRKESTPEET
jgi:hypothetical protein